MVVTDRRLRIITVVVVCLLLGAIPFARPVAAMYRDFGTTPPTLTRWVFVGWVPLALAALPAAVVAYTAASRAVDTAWRRRLLWGALGFAAIALVVCGYALQLPSVPIMAR